KRDDPGALDVQHVVGKRYAIARQLALLQRFDGEPSTRRGVRGAKPVRQGGQHELSLAAAMTGRYEARRVPTRRPADARRPLCTPKPRGHDCVPRKKWESKLPVIKK